MLTLVPMARQPFTITSLGSGGDPFHAEDLLRAANHWVSFGDVAQSPRTIQGNYTPSLRKRQREVVGAGDVRNRTGRARGRIAPAVWLWRIRTPPEAQQPFLAKASNHAVASASFLQWPWPASAAFAPALSNQQVLCSGRSFPHDQKIRNLSAGRATTADQRFTG
jgi:hypothetical protein